MMRIGSNEISGYDIVRNDQDRSASSLTRPHHGLVMYIRSDSEIHTIHRYSSTNLEFIFATVSPAGKGRCQVVVVYKSPKCSMSELRSKLTAHLLPLLDTQCRVVVIGDFNVDLRSSCTEFMRYMETTFKCTQFQENATTDSGSVIDLVFSNSEVVCRCG